MTYRSIYTILLGLASLATTANADNDLQKMGLYGNVKTYSRLNGSTLTKKYTFNEKGMLVKIEDNTKGEIQTIKYNADGDEELRTTTDKNGVMKDSVATSYKTSGKKKAISSKFYDETKKFVKADDKWFDAEGRLIKHREIVIDQEGILRGYQYADDGEKEIITRFFDDEPDGSLEKTYDAHHNFILEVDLDERKVPNTKTTRTFSKKDIKTSETVETFCLGVFNGRTARLFDKKGNLAKEEIFDKNNKLIIGRDLVYDKKGNLLQETYTDGRKTTYVYNKSGNLEVKTDINANGKTQEQQFSYDKYNNLTMHKDGNGQTDFQYEYFAK